MSYTPPFIPRADTAFRAMAQAFADNISRAPAAFMMTPAEAANVMADFVRFDETFSIANNEQTRTRPMIVAKNDARTILRHTIRSYAVHIRANDGITDGDKLSIGVRPKNPDHTRRKCPTTSPLLDYIGALPGLDQLVYHDSNRPTSKAKPYGAERLELWVAYSTGGPGEVGTGGPKVSQARLVGSFKKSKMLVDHDPQRDSRMDGDGKPTYWARWVGFDGSVGPWSLACRPCSIRKQPQAALKDADKEAKAASAGDAPLRMAA